MKNMRYTLLDILRGFTIISMVFFHTTWDLVFLFDVKLSGYNDTLALWWQQSICWSFILLSGFCFSLGKHKLRRGLEVFGASVIITVVTALFMPENRVLFGILSALGFFMILSAVIEKFLKKINPYAGFILMSILFVLTKNVNDGFLGFGSWNLYQLPSRLYSNLFTAFLGFPSDEFFSGDYFSVFPWIFLFWCGFYLYEIFKKLDLLKYLSPIRIAPLEWLGRHSLIIYVLHQPIIYGILYLFFYKPAIPL